AESSYVPQGEPVEQGEGAGHEGDDLQARRVAVDGQVAGEVGGPGPTEEGAGDGADGAGRDEEPGGGRRERDGPAGGRLPGGGGGLGGGVGHAAHALSATRSPSRPCGLKRSTRMRRTKAHTGAQLPPPSWCMPGMSAM